ncbi:class I SAM-dependent methyltransferase [Geomesophilobacter sediminis]|uniref:Methyltransferase domain-containing protein n=1 Tax=Geomesophilobacter sediminis TaxID=2798584 RepID=A0A8J7JCL9_9BACT|nr:methyltransferase domain-containing protein [Geomesophilobacter sediminis]MBJ6724613.1 methyltransferase domain-containing protein [Geomesophilobacter sediminis]
MKLFLVPHLICPACLPKERPLDLVVDHESEGDVVSGKLVCTKCRRKFPIRDGVATLLADPEGGASMGQRRYEEGEMAGRYLWSHFADLFGAADAGSTHGAWTECLLQPGPALDAGCSVGRTTFEMARRGGWAVGCDLSVNFVKTARRLARQRSLSFTLPLEGNLPDTFRVELPAAWPTDQVEFVVADALRLPFARETFRQTASLNLLDRVGYPLAHLYEMNRVAQLTDVSFLFASPFSWSNGPAPQERWLGGTNQGTYPGRGIDNVRAILEGKGNVIAPPWQIARSGSVTWTLRSHAHHRELIDSQYLVAVR